MTHLCAFVRIKPVILTAAALLLLAGQSALAKELAFFTDTDLKTFKSSCKKMNGSFATTAGANGGKRGTCETETTIVSCSYNSNGSPPSGGAYCTGETDAPSQPAKMVRIKSVKGSGKGGRAETANGLGGNGNANNPSPGGGAAGGNTAGGGNTATVGNAGHAIGGGCSGGVC